MVSIVALLLWLIPNVVQATTYYVETTGSDSNVGDEDAPFRTVTKCAGLLVAGDTCYVKNGTYSEVLVHIKASGTADAPIKLMAYPNHAPVIYFDDNNPNAPKNWRMLLQVLPGHNKPIAHIHIEGLTIEGGAGTRWYNCQSCVIRRNWFKNPYGSGLYGTGGIDNVIDRNIISNAGDPVIGGHGMYLTGARYTITNNIIYAPNSFGIQLRGNYNPNDATDWPSPEFGKTENALISNNLFAYSYDASGIVLYGSMNTNATIENNIFYENGQNGSNANGVRWVSCCSTGAQIRNNLSYATSPRSTVFLSGATEGTHYTQSGNRVNTHFPAFVNAPATTIASPDFRLTARSPLDFALTTVIPNNGLVGPFQPPATPTSASITTNKITLTLPMSAAVPVQELSTAGVSFACTSNVCPGSPAVSSVSRAAGTDSQIETTISGITSNACVSHADPVTISYNSSTGSWTGNDSIGPYPGLHQKLLSFTNVAVTNNCTGSGPPGASAAYITYAFEDGSGTTVSDTSGNALHATTSGTWVSGKTGFGIKVASGTTQQTTIPYGSGIDPTTQSMTWVIPVYIQTGQTAVTQYVFGPEIGTNQRGYVAAHLGTWRVTRQGNNVSAVGASNLAVTEGWNHLCVRWDSGTDTVTLYKNGVAGIGGATGAYTSYAFSSNFEFPILGTGFPSTVTEAIFDDTQVFTSLQDCPTLYAAWNAPPPPPGGALKQAAVGFGGVVLDTAKNPIVLGSLSHGISAPKRGGAVLLFEVKCNAGTPCDQTAFKLVYARNGSSVWQQVPNTETADGTWMWGNSAEADLNNGLRATSLTGSCTMQTGSTIVTADQVPSVVLAANACTVLAYIVHVDGVAGVDYFDYKIRTQDNVDLPGGYDEIARIRVVNSMASGIGF